LSSTVLGKSCLYKVDNDLYKTTDLDAYELSLNFRKEDYSIEWAGHGTINFNVCGKVHTKCNDIDSWATMTKSDGSCVNLTGDNSKDIKVDNNGNFIRTNFYSK
jgi:hypothetical protein